jgi:hypothetical protein
LKGQRGTDPDQLDFDTSAIIRGRPGGGTAYIPRRALPNGRVWRAPSQRDTFKPTSRGSDAARDRQNQIGFTATADS